MMDWHHDRAGNFAKTAHDLADPCCLGVVSFLLDVERGGYRIDEYKAETDAVMLLEMLRDGLQLLRQGLKSLRRIEIRQLPGPCYRSFLGNFQMGQRRSKTRIQHWPAFCRYDDAADLLLHRAAEERFPGCCTSSEKDSDECLASAGLAADKR